MIQTSAPDLSTPLIVVVDDDAAVRNALKFALELEGYQVETCESGEALLDHALPAGGACLVVDQILPGISGLEALQQLRGRDVGLPALLITSHPKPALRAAAAAAGVPIIEKPLLGDALLARIRTALTA